jgi:hypothetical protein
MCQFINFSTIVSFLLQLIFTVTLTLSRTDSTCFSWGWVKTSLMDTDSLVYLQCIKDGSRLRVRILSSGYFTTANCQFPRALREEGRYFSAPVSSVRLAGNSGTYFYRVKHPITVLTERPTPEQLRSSQIEESEHESRIVEPSKKKRKVQVEQPVCKPVRVFENEEEPNCVICLDNVKEIILVPCGHYCLCKSCFTKLSEVSYGSRKCPMCRQVVVQHITPDMLQ